MVVLLFAASSLALSKTSSSIIQCGSHLEIITHRTSNVNKRLLANGFGRDCIHRALRRPAALMLYCLTSRMPVSIGTAMFSLNTSRSDPAVSPMPGPNEIHL